MIKIKTRKMGNFFVERKKGEGRESSWDGGEREEEGHPVIKITLNGPQPEKRTGRFSTNPPKTHSFL